MKMSLAFSLMFVHQGKAGACVFGEGSILINPLSLGPALCPVSFQESPH